MINCEKNIKKNNKQVEVNKDLCYNKLDDFRKILNQCNILEMDRIHFVDYIINQIINSLDDPYASYYTANEMKIVSEEFLYDGFSYYIENGQCVIDNCIPDSEAYNQGLKKGDIIIAIDNISISECDVVEINDMLKVRPVVISVLHGNENKLVQLHNERKKHSISNQLYKNVCLKYRKEWLLIKILTFNREELEEIKNALEKSNCNNIIFDLRENRGGSVEVCLLVLNLILKKGEKICQICQKEKIELEIVEEGTVTARNLYVLVNKNTKSSAEIFASAIKANGGYVIGSKTYGKGSIQLIYHFDKYDASCLKLTVAECKTVNGEVIEKKGIEPNYYVKDIDSYQKMEEIIILCREASGCEKENAATMQDSI